MTLGLSRLRLLPKVFWQLSLPEFSAMTGVFSAQAVMSRRNVEALMRQFPD